MSRSNQIFEICRAAQLTELYGCYRPLYLCSTLQVSNGFENFSIQIIILILRFWDCLNKIFYGSDFQNSKHQTIICFWNEVILLISFRGVFYLLPDAEGLSFFMFLNNSQNSSYVKTLFFFGSSTLSTLKMKLYYLEISLSS